MTIAGVISSFYMKMQEEKDGQCPFILFTQEFFD